MPPSANSDWLSQLCGAPVNPAEITQQKPCAVTIHLTGSITLQETNFWTYLSFYIRSVVVRRPTLIVQDGITCGWRCVS